MDYIAQHKNNQKQHNFYRVLLFAKFLGIFYMDNTENYSNDDLQFFYEVS